MAPFMFVMNKSLSEMKELPEHPYPRTETQLVSKMVSGPKGSLRIVTMKDALTEDMVGRTENVRVGLFGTNCRRLAHEAKLAIDYVFNGFESCISECLMGRDAILICDADYVDLVEKKIETLKGFGSDISYTIA